MANADFPGQFLSLLELAGCQALGDRRHGDRGIPQGFIRRLGDDRAVDPPEKATATRP